MNIDRLQYKDTDPWVWSRPTFTDIPELMEFIDLLMRETLLKDQTILVHPLLVFMIFKYFLQHSILLLKMY